MIIKLRDYFVWRAKLAAFETLSLSLARLQQPLNLLFIPFIMFYNCYVFQFRSRRIDLAESS